VFPFLTEIENAQPTLAVSPNPSNCAFEMKLNLNPENEHKGIFFVQYFRQGDRTKNNKVKPDIENW
jgi:hypothetical protein